MFSPQNSHWQRMFAGQDLPPPSPSVWSTSSHLTGQYGPVFPWSFPPMTFFSSFLLSLAVFLNFWDNIIWGLSSLVLWYWKKWFSVFYEATHLVPYCVDEHLHNRHSWSGRQPSPPPKDSYTHWRGQASGPASCIPPVMFFSSFLLNLAALFNFRDFIIFSFDLVYTQWTAYSSGPPQLYGTHSIWSGQPNISGVLWSW